MIATRLHQASASSIKVPCAMQLSPIRSVMCENAQERRLLKLVKGPFLRTEPRISARMSAWHSVCQEQGGQSLLAPRTAWGMEWIGSLKLQHNGSPRDSQKPCFIRYSYRWTDRPWQSRRCRSQ